MLNLERLREQINEQLLLWDQASMGLGIVKDGEVLLVDGFGLRDIENNIPADGDTLYQIGSCSKAFTSAAAAILVDQGKLEWDKPLRDYLPWLRMKDSFASEHVTTRDMLCHRTGLPRYDAWWICHTEVSRREAAKGMRYMDNVCDFRAGWNYQNYCYIVIGLLIEELSGLTWEEFVKQNILQPLGMKRTTFYQGVMESDGNYGKPYERAKITDSKGFKPAELLRSTVEDPEKGIGAAYGPAGSIISCASDMVKWVKFHLDNGKVGDRQLISEANMKELHRMNMVIENPITGDWPEEDMHGYGMGWFIHSHRGHKFVEHGGNITGYSGYVAMIPDQNLGIVAFVNFDGSQMHNATAFEIIDRILDIPESENNWHERFREARAKKVAALVEASQKQKDDRIENTSPSHAIADYAGTYYNDAYRELEITEDNGVLTFRYGIEKSELEHYHYDTFRTCDESCMLNDMLVRFVTGADGKVSELHFDMDLDPRMKTAVFIRKEEKKTEENA